MNLIIDVGNSYVKLAVFKGSELLDRRVVLLKAVEDEIDVLAKHYLDLDNVIISSVGNLDKLTVKSISKRFNVLVLDSNTKLPFKNLYSTPKTLGVDRIALVCSSIKKFSEKNVLIIDAGTCVTYDFININNEYLGGAISPGINMRYKALNNFTAKLPLLDKEIPESIIGNSTEASIHSGVVLGFLKEIEGVIECYEEKYSDLTVILTGGDTKFLSKQLKSSIFANPNFLLEGLNYILQFNSNE
ncbi:type III pantothenate kinase [Algibacter amylolyticus]|uniref:Type III pantothenate kinase n=1 Tax=Algibacter amylolyticus TaxID=1608400 RepID=A0A5M7AWZ9_9FLAO|nr:type III pantothenate kinase [Algibacter amylolyticus]KAA5820608.1 type III pantothenate kinase [Algibacter amylolyticus]MBB5269928.1 type III pantothenate kinase [Algibacter amylolyticus]TSJ71281.1 type III pantothenate kinase [Algibacter amylolyticus]